MKELVPQLITDLKIDQQRALKLCNYGEAEGNLQGIPILQHADPREFAELFLEDSAPRETVMAAFLERYSNDTHQNQLNIEHEWVASVEKEFIDLVAAETPPYKHLLEYRLSWISSELDKHLKRDKTQAASDRS